MLKLRAKKRVQNYKSVKSYIRAVYVKNKSIIDSRIPENVLPPKDFDHPEKGTKTRYEVFRDQTLDQFRVSDELQEAVQNALSKRNPKMAIKGTWNRAIDRTTRSTLITPHGKGYEEQILEEFWQQATKQEKSKFTRKLRKNKLDKKATVDFDAIEYIGYDDEYAYFVFEDEYLIAADRNTSPKAGEYKKYEIYYDSDDVNRVKKELLTYKQNKLKERNDAKLMGAYYGTGQK